MNTTLARRAAVVVLGIVLLLAAIPATAAPPHRSEVEEPSGLSLKSLAAWLTALWPDGPGAGLPVASWLATDAGGELPRETPPTVETAGGPTDDPERGSDLDPNG